MPALTRKLGVTDAVMIGLGSMIGAGIFAAFAPAADVAGTGLLIGLFIAGIVAFCNATSSAQLAAQYPTSGGTYIYGRERLGQWPGFFAGWSFVVGKTASCAAMALTFAAYAAPAGWEKPIAIAAVLGLAAVNYFGVTRTATLTRIIVVVVLVILALIVAIGFMQGNPNPQNLGTDLFIGGPYGILQSAGLLFFAFAGYARIATMGEEVKNPTKTIPRAITTALFLVLAIYFVIAVTAIVVVGSDGLAESSAPLVDIVMIADAGWAVPVVRFGAAMAALGALLALITGIGRTSLAMARHNDLPKWVAAVHPKYFVPHHAEIVLAIIVSSLVLVVDLRGVIGFSSFGVLLYYFIANISAMTQKGANRRYPKFMQILGAVGCLTLVATLPFESIITGLIVLIMGVVFRTGLMKVSNR